MVPFTLRDCNDERPCIVLEEPLASLVTIAPISAAAQLYNPLLHFQIPANHPDFPTTGLRRTSYVLGEDIRDVQASKLQERVGQLNGDLRTKFVQWIG